MGGNRRGVPYLRPHGNRIHGQFFTARAPELYLRPLSAVVILNPHSQVGSLVHYQTPTHITSRWIMVVHTACAGLAILFGVLQFSKRVRRNWPTVHRVSGRLMLIIVAASMGSALGFSFRTGSATTTSGPPFYNILLIFALFVLAAAVLAFVAITNGQVRLQQGDELTTPQRSYDRFEWQAWGFTPDKRA